MVLMLVKMMTLVLTLAVMAMRILLLMTQKQILTPTLPPSEATVQLVQQQLDNRRLPAPHVCPALSVRWED